MNTQPQVSMGSFRLFTSPSAFPNPQRLRIFLHEKGIADQFNERIYDMTPVGEQWQWRHLKMNPWGETPTLELPDGTFVSCPPSGAGAEARTHHQSRLGRALPQRGVGPRRPRQPASVG